MPDKLSQDTSHLRLSTPLGSDTLIPVKFQGNERISHNFEWRVHCLLNDGESPVDPQAIIGKNCTVTVMHGDDMSLFDGLCTDILFKGFRRSYGLYEVILRPWTWILTRETECEIFHDKKPDDIIRDIFNDRGFSDFRFDISESYPVIAYCVQYQETTYDFVSRLMEKFGMFFYFEHEDGKHTLVITDDVSSLPDIESASANIKYQANTHLGVREHRIFNWASSYRLRTAKVDVDDYNYEKPNTALEKTGNAPDSPGHSFNQQTYYVYPSGHLEPRDGQSLADVMVQVERGDAERKFGVGNVPAVRSGYTFSLEEHPNSAENTKYFTVGVRHEAYVVIYMTNGPGQVLGPDLRFGGTFKHPHLGGDYKDTTGYYSGEYEVADVTKPYKAPKKTPAPRIHGAQTAVVIRDKNAPSDEEIDVDDKGRILVKFHWNESDEKSDKCSCRVRVAQIWAGSGWGGVWIPRVNMEVVVDFLNGDPDCPLVTGCVYNGNNAPPINFPGDKTQSTIKSQSSKGGTSDSNFNELRFEDKKDDEEIYIHAERDRKMIVEHDDDVEIGNDHTKKIGGSHTWELTGGDQTITLKGKPGTKDKYGATITKKGHRTTTLEMGDETLDVKQGKRTTTINGNDQKTIKQGNESTEIKMGNQTTIIKMGNQKTDIKLGKGQTKAMQSFEIKVGASSLKLEPAKITIKSVQIDINAAAKLTTNGSAMAQHKAGGMLQLQGGIIKIN